MGDQRNRSLLVFIGPTFVMPDNYWESRTGACLKLNQCSQKFVKMVKPGPVHC